MHEYYQANRAKLNQSLRRWMAWIQDELQQLSSKPYDALLGEIWAVYEMDMLEHFPYIGGDRVSGTKHLTDSYLFVAMGEVLRQEGVTMDQIGHLMVLAYERNTRHMPWIARKGMGKIFTSPKMLNRMFQKKDAQNAANAAENPGSFETKTQLPPEEGYDFSYHNLVCPLSDFAKQHGYEAYMPYLCNLDYVLFGILGAPLFREHTCFETGDYCDFKLKLDAKPMAYWPPVFTQGKGYR